MYIYSMKTIPQMVFIVSLTILIMLASAGQTYKGGFVKFTLFRTFSVLITEPMARMFFQATEETTTPSSD